jgi:hypothetical protein
MDGYMRAPSTSASPRPPQAPSSDHFNLFDPRTRKRCQTPVIERMDGPTKVRYCEFHLRLTGNQVEEN